MTAVALPQYAPDYRLYLDGRPAPSTLRRVTTRISQTSGLDGADRVELTLADVEHAWLDSPLLEVDRLLELDLGYAPSALERVFSGHIVALSPSFPSSGPVTLSLAAQDARSRLQQSQQTRWFALKAGTWNIPMPDAAIAALIAAGHQLVPIIDPIDAAFATLLSGADALVGLASGSADGVKLSLQKQIRQQSGEDSLTFLKKICVQNGWEMSVEHTGSFGGHALRFFAPAAHTEPICKLEWGRSLLEFTPRLSSVGQVAKISVQFWVDTLKTEFRASVGYDWDKSELTFELRPVRTQLDVQGQSVTLGEGSSPNDAVGSQGRSNMEHQEEIAGAAVTKDTALKVLMSSLLGKLNTRLTATITTLGDPALQAGRVVEIVAPVRRFSGRYRITEATHTLDGGGYRTDCALRHEIWLHPPELRPPHVSFSM